MGLILTLLAIPGGFVSLFLLDKYATLLQWLRGANFPDPLLVSLPDEYFFIVLSMTVSGAVAVWRWDAIFPDRRDYMNLVHLPISSTDNFSRESDRSSLSRSTGCDRCQCRLLHPLPDRRRRYAKPLCFFRSICSRTCVGRSSGEHVFLPARVLAARIEHGVPSRARLQESVQLYPRGRSGLSRCPTQYQLRGPKSAAKRTRHSSDLDLSAAFLVVRGVVSIPPRTSHSRADHSRSSHLPRRDCSICNRTLRVRHWLPSPLPPNSRTLGSNVRRSAVTSVTALPLPRSPGAPHSIPESGIPLCLENAFAQRGPPPAC